MRWISSTKSTSPSPRFVRIAARSLGRSSAGPLVGWKPAPISFATIWASVVLPSPGGPLNNRWSTGSSRRRAPSINRWSCSLTRSWPTKSVRVVGRSATSNSRSSGSTTAASMSRSSSTSAAHLLQRLAQHVVDLAALVVDVAGRLGGFLRREAERDERVTHVDDRASLAGKLGLAAETIAQVDDDALRDLLAHAGN